jgi:hypothetical protein
MVRGCVHRQSRLAQCFPHYYRYILVYEPLPSLDEYQRRLTSLEPRLDFAMLFLTLVTATCCLSVA